MDCGGAGRTELEGEKVSARPEGALATEGTQEGKKVRSYEDDKEDEGEEVD